MRFKRHSWLAIGAFLVTGLTGGANLGLSAPVQADSGPVATTIKLFGAVMLHPDRALHLHPKYPGVVRQVFKKIGDTVRPGEALARVENNVGIQTYDLVSTIGGQVVDRQVAVGQSIDEQIEAFTVADMSDVLVTLIAYPRDLRTLKIGQDIHIKNAGIEASAKITYIAPVLDERSRTAAVHVYIPNQNGHWAPGKNVQAVAIVGQKNAAVRIPVSSLTKMIDGRDAVVLVVNETKTTTPIVIGAMDEQFAEVTSGLNVGASILVGPTKESHDD